MCLIYWDIYLNYLVFSFDNFIQPDRITRLYFIWDYLWWEIHTVSVYTYKERWINHITNVYLNLKVTWRVTQKYFYGVNSDKVFSHLFIPEFLDSRNAGNFEFYCKTVFSYSLQFLTCVWIFVKLKFGLWILIRVNNIMWLMTNTSAT